jgi:hypothetical protein
MNEYQTVDIKPAEETEIFEGKPFQCYFITTNFTDLGSNPSWCRGKSATNRLNCATTWTPCWLSDPYLTYSANEKISMQISPTHCTHRTYFGPAVSSECNDCCSSYNVFMCLLWEILWSFVRSLIELIILPLQNLKETSCDSISVCVSIYLFPNVVV